VAEGGATEWWVVRGAGGRCSLAVVRGNRGDRYSCSVGGQGRGRTGLAAWAPSALWCSRELAVGVGFVPLSNT
jgi:hypothetical protein